MNNLSPSSYGLAAATAVAASFTLSATASAESVESLINSFVQPGNSVVFEDDNFTVDPTGGAGTFDPTVGSPIQAFFSISAVGSGGAASPLDSAIASTNSTTTASANNTIEGVISGLVGNVLPEGGTGSVGLSEATLEVFFNDDAFEGTGASQLGATPTQADGLAAFTNNGPASLVFSLDGVDDFFTIDVADNTVGEFTFGLTNTTNATALSIVSSTLSTGEVVDLYGVGSIIQDASGSPITQGDFVVGDLDAAVQFSNASTVVPTPSAAAAGLLGLCGLLGGRKRRQA